MKLTKIGVALVAALAMMAVVASAASAAKFQASTYPNMTTASQVGEHVFKVDGQSVKCTTASFESAEQAEAVESLTVTASYSGCTAFGFVGATVKMNSCDYHFLTPTGSGDVYTGGVEVKCTSASIIEINSSSAFGTCEVRVGAQKPSGGNTYTNSTSGANSGKVEISTNVTGIKANVIKDSGICPLSGTGERTNSTYEGSSLASATGGAKAFIG